MAMPASSIPMGPIILPTLLNVLVIGAGSEMCSRYSRAPAAHGDCRFVNDMLHNGSRRKRGPISFFVVS